MLVCHHWKGMYWASLIHWYVILFRAETNFQIVQVFVQLSWYLNFEYQNVFGYRIAGFCRG